MSWIDSSDKYPIGPEHGILFEATLLKHHLDLLVLEGAELCFPASVHQAKLREARVFRELEGGMPEDAALDVEIQQSFLRVLEKRLDTVKKEGICNTADQQAISNTQLVSALEPLLNSHNQFAVDSGQLTPAYQDQLMRVVPLLQQTQLSLMIYGHTDPSGSKEYNQSLSYRRASSVAAFLQKEGISQHRIKIIAKGEAQPYAEGDSPEHYHSNRRVVIELVDQHFNRSQP